jgi:uncharacterized protein YuzE
MTKAKSTVHQSGVKVTWDKKLDVAYIRLRRARVAKTIKLRPEILADYDSVGRIIGIELLPPLGLVNRSGGKQKNEAR